MEEIQIFALSIFFGGFLLFMLMMCSLRFLAYLKDEDTSIFCFRRKQLQTDVRRRRIQHSLLTDSIFPRSENTFPRPENTTGYIIPPDEILSNVSLCQPYVYDDRCSTGLRMLTNLPVLTAPPPRIHNNALIVSSLYPLYPAVTISPLFPRHFIINQDSEAGEAPPPDYAESQLLQQGEDDMEMTEPPPPSYSDCMQQRLRNEDETTHI